MMESNKSVIIKVSLKKQEQALFKDFSHLQDSKIRETRTDFAQRPAE